MRASFRVLLALAACCACVALVPAQADPNAMLDPNWVDPNLQTEGFSAALTAAGVAGNPLGLVPVRPLQCRVLQGAAVAATAAGGATQVHTLTAMPLASPSSCQHTRHPPSRAVQAVSQAEGMEAPNGGMTFSSQHNAEQSDDAENLWSWEFGGYNVETVGLTTVHNLKVSLRGGCCVSGGRSWSRWHRWVGGQACRQAGMQRCVAQLQACSFALFSCIHARPSLRLHAHPLAARPALPACLP